MLGGSAVKVLAVWGRLEASQYRRGLWIYYYTLQKFRPVITGFRHSGTALATTKIMQKTWTHQDSC